MNKLDLGIIFILLSILGIMVKTAYFQLPVYELKRRADSREKTAAALYKVSMYGFTLSATLWLYIGFSSAAGFILLAKALPFWLSLLAIAAIVYLVFSFIPSLPNNKVNTLLALALSPVLAKLLYYIHPVFQAGQSKYEKLVSTRHSGIYEKEDLLKFLKGIKKQDNRIDDSDINVAIRSIEFSNKKVMDIMLPKKSVKTVRSKSVVGPVLINDIHESGQSYVLVKEKDEVIGILAFADLGIKSTGLVEDHMETKVGFIEEDKSLTQALASLYESKYPVLIVNNANGEFKGVLTIERVIDELLGHTTRPKDDSN
jgi:CBS domain containing-hemolysin-like protein